MRKNPPGSESVDLQKDKSTFDQDTSDSFSSVSIFKDSDIKEAYEERYKGSYQSRFRSPTTTTESERLLVNRIVTESLKSDTNKPGSEFILLDIGGAGGRFFNVFENIAEQLREKAISLTVICYDLVGLDEGYRKMLTEADFEITEYNDNLESLVQLAAECTSKKLNFKFIIGPPISYNTDVINLAEEMVEKIGKVDASISMFGSISHIMGRENRITFLNAINQLTKGFFGGTFPSTNIHQKDIEIYSTLHRRHPTFLEEGDAEYLAENGKPILYHHYENGELEEDFRRAGFKNNEVRTSSVMHPLRLLKTPELEPLEGIMSKAANNISPYTQKLLRLTSYFEVLAESQKHYLLQNEENYPSPTIEDAETIPLLKKNKNKDKCTIL